MSRWFTVLLAMVVLVGLTAAVYAEDNTLGAGAEVVYQSNDQVDYFLTADELDFVACIKCQTTGTFISVEVADCCVYGDVWRAIISKGKKLTTTSNQDAEGVALGISVYSPAVTVNKAKATIYVATANPVPGTLPAGMYTRVTSDGTLTCKIKNIVGGPIPE